jgi:exodeoxyribonuclease VII large subunit
MFMAEPYSDEYNPEGLVAKVAPGDNATPLTITEISQRLKRVVEDQFGFVRLRGELSGVTRPASGHLYCCLKDDGARLDGVMWRGSVARLGFRPENGIEVIATGKLTTYPGRSNYQIVIDRMEIAGEGALLALLAKTRERLAAEGLFDAAKKRPIPFLPRVIGVVTSPTGAVIRDILHRLEDRFPCHVVVWPVAVQGQGAAEQVAAAVRGFSALGAEGPVARPDVVIIARGGGSIEDLWCFNEEVVVRAIAACTIPVISAVGHETDTTLADFAADRRAPTPTAAAEMAVPVREELLAQLIELGLRKRRAIMRPVTLGRERLEARARRLPRPEALLAAPTQRQDDLGERARRGLGERIVVARTSLQRAAGRLSVPLLAARLARASDRLVAVRLTPALLTARLVAHGERLVGLQRLMQSLNPDNILEKGFVRVTGPDGHTLMTRAQAAAVPALSLHFRDGVLAAVPAEARPAPPRPAPTRKTDSADQGKLL